MVSDMFNNYVFAMMQIKRNERTTKGGKSCKKGVLLEQKFPVRRSIILRTEKKIR